ncbi:MAG TPA: hypothetical protein VLM89_07005, partial [Phycisphaerae bacterium]|nr:hypothetical protein [Phycisphaerae bacterium]
MRPTDAGEESRQCPVASGAGSAWITRRSWVGHALIGLVVVAMVAMVGRLAYIESHLRPKLLEWSQRRQCSTVTIPGRRGAILDRRLRVLAGSHDRPTVYADPRMIEDHEATARQLALVLGRPAEELKKLLDDPTSPGYVILKRAADRNEAEGVRTLGIRGVDMVSEPV